MLVTLLYIIVSIPFSSAFELILDNEVIQFANKSYQISLFEKRVLTIRMEAHGDILGVKYQIQSTNSEVLEIEGGDNREEILADDFYILRKRKDGGRIWNIHSAPKLIYVNATLMSNRTWTIRSRSMNLTTLIIRLNIFYANNRRNSSSRSVNILVTSPQRRLDSIFQIILPITAVLTSICMGILLETEQIVSLFQHPKPLLIGFLTQYGLMPFLAIALGKLFHYTPWNSLALIAIGCCPGHGMSNQWTILLDGDVNLSAVMSIVSTAAAFVILPFYLRALGQIYADELTIQVPYFTLARSLALFVIPYLIGILIGHFSLQARSIIEKRIRPLVLSLMVLLLPFTLVVNWYLFRMIDLHVILTAPFLPCSGFLLGCLIAWISLEHWQQVKTVAIETGLQNTAIALMIILSSFPQPYATEAVLVAMIVEMFSAVPLWVIFLIRKTSMFGVFLRLNKHK